KQRPAIVVDRRAEHVRIWKFDDPAARMIRRKILPAELPKRRVQIADINHIACRIAYFYPVADSVGRSHQNVDPPDETRKHGLKRKAEDERCKPKRRNRGLPVGE